ncbi:MAG: DnaJ domain-containing protein [Lachnospiraceae bacterium]|nr:DnaJ domain-containing protein [Lachnospiraceae bacterium]MBR6664181.1 DnaJ domain-containing protein [Lachnospiraceae bacterium]
MSYWELMGIPPTDDINLIKKAYAEKSKLYHPETHPEQFQELHHAYKFLVAQCKRKKAYEEKVQAEEKTKQPDLETLDIPPEQISWGFSGSTKKPKEQPEAPEPAQAPVAENKTPSKPAQAPNGASQTPVTERKTVQADADFLSLVEQHAVDPWESDPLILQLKKMLDKKAMVLYPTAWKKYFFSRDFLKRQYDPGFLKVFTAVIEQKLEESIKDPKHPYRKLPIWLYNYLNIVYGTFDQNGGSCYAQDEFSEHIYKKEVIAPLQSAFERSAHKYFDCYDMEKHDYLISERYAFYIYRNLLEILEPEEPDREKLRRWLMDAFDLTNTSHVLELLHCDPARDGYGKRINNTFRYQVRIINSPYTFELLGYLLESNHPNSPILEDVMEEVMAEYEKQNHYRNEREILMMMIEENREKRK